MAKRTTNSIATADERLPNRKATGGLTVDDVAMQLFAKMYMDTSGFENQHLAERAYQAAEAFMEVKAARKP